MKNKILFGAMLFMACAFTMPVNAQLEVKNSGRVQISKNMAIGTAPDQYASLKILHTSTTTTPYYGIYSQINTNNSMPTSSIYAIYGYANTLASTSNFPIQSVAGVFGKAYRNYYLVNTFSAGVAGMSHSHGGVGVYGGVNYTMNLPTSFSGGTYAGYFDGTVKINGTLILPATATISDMSQSENVESVPFSLAKNLQLLNPVSYTLKQDTLWKYDKDAKELQGLHYGLIAQDVQKIFPEIVYERGGILSINYTEFIPLLIKQIQELSAEVEALKKNDKARMPQKKDADQAVLFQNSPNPFSIDTKIDYQLPQTTQEANLYIYNMNGLQVAEYPVYCFGNGSIIVSAGTLDAGMYLYSLIADGQVVDTKRMILTK